MLPIEIFEAVIDRASDDTATLGQISLTCHAFLPRARYHLFGTVVLQDVQQVQSYGEFLDSHPWVSPLVRKLVHSGFIPISVSHPTAHLPDVVPLHLLSHLPNLRTWEIGVAGVESRSEAGAWLSCQHTSLSDYQSFSTSVRNLDLAYVHFEDISDFMELVSAFTGIHNLACAYISIKSSTEANPRIIRPTQIKSLKVSPFSDIF